ncbi:MAG TPA: hypothetical protein VF192_00915 [Longimicrobiales bacterium]
MNPIKPEVRKVPQAGPNRSILYIDGMPAVCNILLRRSRTAHGRVKAMLAADITPPDAPEGEFAAAPVAEFRLEMN